MPHLEFPWGQESDLGHFNFPQCKVEQGVGKASCTSWVPHSSTYPLHAMPGSVCVCRLGLDPSLLHPPADSCSFSPQTQAPPCLQTPQPRAQAQSPLCHLHSEEPARPFSPHPPGRSRFQKQPSPTTGTLPQLESSSLRKESSSCPSTAPTCPAEACTFISDYSRTSV